MADTKKYIKDNYPLPVYNFRVSIAGENIAFSQVSGLNITYETHTYKESPTSDNKAGPVVMRTPAQQGEVKITLKKGVVKKNSIPKLYEWIKGISVNQVDKKDVGISLLDEAGQPVISWNVINAFPTKLEAPSFDSNSNDVAIETIELSAENVLIS